MKEKPILHYGKIKKQCLGFRRKNTNKNRCVFEKTRIRTILGLSFCSRSKENQCDGYVRDDGYLGIPFNRGRLIKNRIPLNINLEPIELWFWRISVCILVVDLVIRRIT